MCQQKLSTTQERYVLNSFKTRPILSVLHQLSQCPLCPSASLSPLGQMSANKHWRQVCFCMLRVVRCAMCCMVCSVLFLCVACSMCCVLRFACFVLRVVCCVLRVACCVLRVACCVLRVACRVSYSPQQCISLFCSSTLHASRRPVHLSSQSTNNEQVLLFETVLL